MAHRMPAVRDRRLEIVELVGKLCLPKTDQYPYDPTEGFSQKTSIAGVQTPNWAIVLGAVVVILLIYSSMH